MAGGSVFIIFVGLDVCFHPNNLVAKQAPVPNAVATDLSLDKTDKMVVKYILTIFRIDGFQKIFFFPERFYF